MGRYLFAGMAVVTVVVAVVLAVAAFAGSGQGTLRQLALPLLLAMLAAAFVGLVGWRHDRGLARGLAESQARAAQAEEELAALRQRHSELEARHRDEVARERTARQRLTRVLETEREWGRELRAQVFRLHEQRGTLGATGRVEEMVLRVALELCKAQKGLLFSRQDADGDGKLDLVAHHGFEHDPDDSAVAHRFATEVIERDRTVRENQVDHTGDQRGPADEEIENLVAIPVYLQERFSGAVVCANREGGFDDHQDDVLLALGDHAGAVLHQGRLQADLHSAYLGTIRVLAEAIEAKDRMLRDHSDEVASHVVGVAERLGLDERMQQELVFASLLHDVGKIGISESILLKPGALSPEEQSVVELHPRIGARLIEQVPALRPLAAAVLHHHERWDGQGYPSGLRGEEIPLEARIICVADCFSAMTADRPYREGISADEACAEIERGAGTQFDPQVAAAFVDEVRQSVDRQGGPHALSAALDDPELAVRREPGDALLGRRSARLTDSLTSLYSHRYFREVVASETERAQLQARPFAVVFAELADLDAINHGAGYGAGDDALRAAALAVERAATACSGVACRFSGRRLAILVPGAGEADAQRLGQAVVAELDGLPGMQVGFAAWRAGDQAEDVIARARPPPQPSAVAPAPSTL